MDLLEQMILIYVINKFLVIMERDHHLMFTARPYTEADKSGTQRPHTDVLVPKPPFLCQNYITKGFLRN
jgi:hypothetical protein